MKKLDKEQQETLKKTKTLLFDLEVSPMLAYTYNYYEGNVLKVVEQPKLLCFSYKWLGEVCKPKTICLVDGSVDPKNDSWITNRLWALLDEANVAIAYNGDKFDAKVANTFFIEHGLVPPTPYKMLDPIKAARKYFRFPANKLDEVGKTLQIGKKTDVTCGQLWEDCLNGNKKAYDLMRKYCQNDVVLMEEVYWKLAPYAQTTPINKLVNEELVCPVCGSKEFMDTNKIVPDATQAPSWAYRCAKCGHMTKVPLSKLEREEEGYVKPLNRNISGCF